MVGSKTIQKIIFPEETNSIVEELVEKYKLGPINLFGEEETEIAKKIEEAETPEEKKERADSFPVIKILQLLKETAIGRVPIEKFSFALQQKLDIPQETAEKLARELKTTILDSVQTIKRERGSSSKTLPTKAIKGKTYFSKKSKNSIKANTSDTYREPIE